MSGFYREWTQNNDKCLESQQIRMKIFCDQIQSANQSNQNIIILEDANQGWYAEFLLKIILEFLLGKTSASNTNNNNKTYVCDKSDCIH